MRRGMLYRVSVAAPSFTSSYVASQRRSLHEATNSSSSDGDGGARPIKVKVTVKDRDGKKYTSEYPTGVNLMEAMRDDAVSPVDLPGSCGGGLRCSTCHVFVEGDWFATVAKTSPLSEPEQDLLDSTPEAQDNSRLVCQVKLTPEMDGLELSMPKACRDLRFMQENKA